jgi:hypothetical protein
MSQQPEKIEVSKPVKLTKKGVPRKPHIMTDARKEAFAKCVSARAEKLSSKKVDSSVAGSSGCSSC